MTLEITYPLTTAGNYTYNTDDIEVTGGYGQLVNQAPDTTCLALYTNNVNLSVANGSTIGTAVGGASVSGGKLDLTGGTLKYVNYNADLNADSQQVGAIRFGYIPNYSGAPASTQYLITISKADSDGDNNIFIRHASSGTMEIRIVDSTGANIVDAGLLSWSPTSGTEYEFELNWDITSGATRLFINGTQTGSTQTGTGTRDSSIALFRIGTNYIPTVSPNFSINYIQVFDAVQHTSNYTASGPDLLYVTDTPKIKPASTITAEELSNFIATSITGSSSNVSYTMEVSGTERYWTGSAWTTSTGYPQTNTFTELSSNLSELDLSGGKTARPVVYLTSLDGITNPQIDTMTLSYDFYGPNPGDPSLCIVNGYLRDANNIALAGAQIYVVPKTSQFIDGKNIYVPGKKVLTSSSSDGYFEISLIPSSELVGTVLYDFEVYPSDGKKYTVSSKTVPTTETAEFDDLV